MAHRAHGPRRARALGHLAARRPPRAALEMRTCVTHPDVVRFCDASSGRRGRGRGGGCAEEVGAVEAQLGDRLAYVVERAVLLGLVRTLAVDGRVPAPAQLLERRHVDAAVVK